MESQVKGSIVFIVANLVFKIKPSSLLDCSRTEYLNIDGRVSNETIDIYNFSQGFHISGRENSEGYTLFNYDNGQHIDLSIDGNTFSGFDYGASCYFKGIIKENGSISLFDYGQGTEFNYNIEFEGVIEDATAENVMATF